MSRLLRLIFTGVFLILIGGSVFAQNDTTAPENLPEAPQSSKKADSPDVFQVFIPSNSDFMPIGNYYLIPSALYENIQIAMESEKKNSQNWKIVKARYVGSMVMLTNKLRLYQLKAIYDIELKEGSTVMQLPKMPLFPDGVKFDKNPFQPVIDKSDKYWTFQFENRKSGVYQLELALAPVMETVDQQCRLDITIPKVADSVLELSMPSDSPEITVANSIGAVKDRKGHPTGSISAELGPSDTLSLRWIEDIEKNPQVTVGVDQLFWLRAKTNQVEIHAQFKFRITGGKVGQLSIATDPKLQRSGQFRCEDGIELLPDLGESVSETDGVSRLVFKYPVTGNVTVHAGYVFVSKEFSGIGKLRLLRLGANQARITSSTLGVSYDTLLECDLPPSNVNVNKFRQDWGKQDWEKPEPGKTVAGKPDETPVSAYDLLSADPAWVMSIRAKEIEHEAAIRHSIMVEEDDLKLSADIKILSNGDTFQHRFVIPEELEIDNIEVRDPQDNLAGIRWIVSESVEIDRTRMGTIFLKRPLSGAYTIGIKGHRSITGSRKKGIPIVTLPGVRKKTERLLLYRGHQVLAELDFDNSVWAPLETSESADVKSAFPDSVPVAVLEKNLLETEPTRISRDPSSDDDEVFATISPNIPKISGRQLTSISRGRTHLDERWDVSIEVHGQVSEGVLDLVRLRLDDSAIEPFRIEPNMTIKEERISGGRFLLVKPNQPFNGKFDFSLKFQSLAPASDAVPLVRLEGDGKWTHYVSLPKNLDFQEIDWEVRQLEPADEAEIGELVRNSKTVSAALVSESRIFTASGPDFNASILPQRSPARAFINDIGIYFQKKGRMFGVSVFEVNAYGADHCILQMPKEYELIYVTSGGITARPSPVADGKWRIELWPNARPQKIEIVFRGSLPGMFSKSGTFFERETFSGTIPVPKLENVIVDQTTWRISFDAASGITGTGFGVAQNTLLPIAPALRTTETPVKTESHDATIEYRPAVEASEVPEILSRLNLVRLESMFSAMEAVQGGSNDELLRWYSHWGREWWELKNEVDMLTQQRDPGELRDWKTVFFINGEPPEKTVNSLISTERYRQALMQRHKQTIERLGLSETDAKLAEMKDLPVNPFTNWNMNASFLFGISQGGLDSLTVSSEPSPWSPAKSGLLFHILGGGALFIAVLLARGTRMYDFFAQYPRFCGAVCGILLWAVFGLNIIGGAVLLLTFFSAVWPIWRKHREPYSER